MAFQVVYADEWYIVGKSQTLCGIHADEQGACQSRAVCHRNAIKLMYFQIGLIKSLLHHRNHANHMLSGGYFRNDSTELRMKLRLGRHNVGEDDVTVLYDGSR